jgi:succinyl-CoA synthetase alpha subunit
MSILVDASSRVVVQGITGGEGTFHTQRMIEYGTTVAAGVTPHKGGTLHLGAPVFDTVAEAVRNEGVDASVIFVPAAYAPSAIREAAEAGIRLIVCITEGIEVLSMVGIRDFLRRTPALLVGPNTPGVISPGKAKLGIMPGPIHRAGRVGVVSRSGTLTYEAVHQLTGLGLGQSTAVGIGGDPVVGLSFVDVLSLFERDPETEAVVLIGEIGGTAEEEAAALLRQGYAKPVVAYVAGLTAPPGRRMGHAGAIMSGRQGTASHKIELLETAGARIVRSPAAIGKAVAAALAGKS